MWSAEEITLGAGSGISHGTEPCQMDVSIATGDTRKCPAARKIEQVLPETMAVVRGLPGRNVLDTVLNDLAASVGVNQFIHKFSFQ
jgi:hypothetical protein